MMNSTEVSLDKIYEVVVGLGARLASVEADVKTVKTAMATIGKIEHDVDKIRQDTKALNNKHDTLKDEMGKSLVELTDNMERRSEEITSELGRSQSRLSMMEDFNAFARFSSAGKPSEVKRESPGTSLLEPRNTWQRKLLSRS